MSYDDKKSRRTKVKENQWKKSGEKEDCAFMTVTKKMRNIG